MNRYKEFEPRVKDIIQCNLQVLAFANCTVMEEEFCKNDLNFREDAKYLKDSLGRFCHDDTSILDLPG